MVFLQSSAEGQDILGAFNVELADRLVEIQLSGHVANAEADVLVLSGY